MEMRATFLGETIGIKEEEYEGEEAGKVIISIDEEKGFLRRAPFILSSLSFLFVFTSLYFFSKFLVVFGFIKESSAFPWQAHVVISLFFSTAVFIAVMIGATCEVRKIKKERGS